MEVKDFLKRLNNKAEDGLARLVYAGTVLSKSEKNIHMCVSSGVVLIPISEIESIDQISPGIDENLVYVAVKNADRVKHALRIEQLNDSPPATASTTASHLTHGTVTGPQTPPISFHDACDSTDVFVPPASFSSV